MADNKIRDKILKDAKIEADRIIAEAREESNKILSEAKKQVSEIEKETQRIAENAKRKEMERKLAEVRMETRRTLLSEKRKTLDAVFEEAKKKLLSLKKDEYINFITNRIKNEKWDGESTLILSQRDVNRFGENIFDEILRKLAVGKKIKKEVANFEGGCILKKEKYEFNATIDTILDNLKERLETKLAHLLFD